MSLATTVGRTPRKSVYDTSVYINAIRHRAYYEHMLPHFARALRTTYFCAVVAQELKAGCRTPAARARVETLLRPFQRTGRLMILIALCSVRLGAVVYTANEDDFALVGRYKRFRFVVV